MKILGIGVDIIENKRIKEASLILNDKTFNANEVALLLYGITLNTYRFNKYFSNKKKIRENFPHNPKSSVTYPVPDNIEITLKEDILILSNKPLS